MKSYLSRRHFIKAAAAAGTMACIFPSHVIGANEKINLACIGIGGQGNGDAKWFLSTDKVNIVALCDVAMGSERTQEIVTLCPNAKTFTDFRTMFDKMGNQIDAVCIAVPDHSHFPIAMLAMSLGKHVYVEKPLAHTFQEVELLMKAEKRYNVAAQMGNQGYSGNNHIQFKSWTEAGIIKNVTHVDAFMNSKRSWYGWDISKYPKGETCPAYLDWDLWLGTAQHHDYSNQYAPYNWRGWYDFGCGAFGDWGPHTLDTLHRYLKLGLPETVEALTLEGHNRFIYPQTSTIQFKFPKREKMPAVTINWYDGLENLPPRPDELEEGRKIKAHGKVIYSDELVFLGGTHHDTLRIIPESKMQDMKNKLPKINEKHTDHVTNFLLACKGEEKTRSSFDIAGPLTQLCLLGVIAQRLGGKYQFNRSTKQFTDNTLANKMLVGPPPRKQWQQYYKL